METYKFKKDKKEELLQGRTYVYVAKDIGVTRQHLTDIFTGKTKASKLFAKALVKAYAPDKSIDYFFDE